MGNAVVSKGIGPEIAERGFALVSGLFEPEEMVRLLDKVEGADLPRSRAGLRHALNIQAISTVAQDARLMQLSRGVLGDGAFAFRATLFDKSPDSNWLVVWHQDTALPLRERKGIAGWGPGSVKGGVLYAHAPASALEQVLALRVHLDDSCADNGPLRVLPGSHRHGVLSDAEIEALTLKITAVNCVAPRGAVVAMRPLIVHASSKTASDVQRRVLHIEYAASAHVGEGLDLAMC
jgi:ectoine hydroxylase-related dioxygenase (phytanoyl-CoA dioxygenase family)